MQELNIVEIESVSGGDFATGVAYGGGLLTSVAIGASLGPAGVLVAAFGFSASFFATRYLQKS